MFLFLLNPLQRDPGLLDHFGLDHFGPLDQPGPWCSQILRAFPSSIILPLCFTTLSSSFRRPINFPPLPPPFPHTSTVTLRLSPVSASCTLELTSTFHKFRLTLPLTNKKTINPPSDVVAENPVSTWRWPFERIGESRSSPLFFPDLPHPTCRLSSTGPRENTYRYPHPSVHRPPPSACAHDKARASPNSRSTPNPLYLLPQRSTAGSEQWWSPRSSM